ncbi:MAG: GtrA family protein [Lachnospiraceae bacterium]|nr:GtrA family protein [Lachnospiraceae bacterium]
MDQSVETKEKTGKQKLIDQILKFGVVGVISFLVDFGVYTFICNILGISYIIAGIFGFVISVIVNYLLSMKFVFEGRDDISKTREFVTFVILSAFGLLLNEVILYICVDGIYWHWSWLQSWLSIKLMNMGAKIVATGVVMVYNFVTRKIFLEKK